MGEDAADADEAADAAPPAPRSRRRRVGCGVLLAIPLLLAAALLFAWLARERIAGNFIGNELEARDVQASYEIERIGGRTQILRNIVVGDPARPDLTVERAIVRVNHRLGFPTVGRVTLIRPRLYGSYRRGTLSFGELDKVLFTGPRRGFQWPDLDIAIEDGRALMQTEFGAIGARVAGRGHLQDGFRGELAALTPRLALGGCETARTTVYGQVAIADRRPYFQGPLRYARLRCAGSGLASSQGAVQLDLKADEPFEVIEGEAGLAIGPSAMPYGLLASLRGPSRFTWRDGGLTARYDVAATGVVADQANIARLELEGSLRTRRMFERIEVDADVAGEGVRIGSGLDASLASAVAATQGTLLEPLLAQVRSGLAAQGRVSRLAAELTYRRTGQRTALVVPNAVLRGRGGEALLALSRFQLSDGPGTAPRMLGNFATGGAGLPRIVGSMERGERGRIQARLAMAEYAAGGSRLAVPELVLVQRAAGALGFSGQVRASGPLPGGRAEALVLPVSGNWTPGGTLALWGECTPVRFERLQYANLTLDRQQLTLCPTPGAPILRYGPGGLRLALGAPSLRLAGRLGTTPVVIRSGPVGFAYPGTLSARQLDVALGPPATAQRFLVNDLTARIGTDIAGTFAGTDVRLFSVPLDLLGASGDWRYAAGRLTVTADDFRLQDRREPDRFEPLIARGATLALADNVVTAQALLLEPERGRAVTRVDLRHNLADGRGFADLAVDALTFDRDFQPTALTSRALGVVANVRGTVTGTGRIDWSPAGVTSTGRFSSENLDFAAAFGPVRGASGTLEFTDLLGLTTAPNQRLRVASVNPGIEVTDGEILVQLRGGQVLALQGATWPFMGGTLTMRAVDITFGASETRRYVLEVVGLDAARFVERMELRSISASGIFDGTLPIVFEAGSAGGRIEGGLLLSRPPGGNVSYLGALTYEDLSPMANFAFGALRSLDYKQMRIAMDGNLTGEIVTRVRFDGVSQGAGTTQNFITRAIAGIPIRFDVNIRAPFYQLITSARAMYDPAFIKDPRDIGLLDAQGNVIRRETEGPPPEPVTPADLIPDEAPIQRRESEEMP